jgi:hypothetical protein
MIRPDHPTLSVVRQCRLASIGRSTFYHVPQGESTQNLALMGMIDRQFLGDAVLWGATDDVAPAGRRTAGEHQAGAPTDAAYGSDADLPEAAHQHSRQGA